MNKNIIIAILVVIIIAVGAAFVAGQYGKINTQINFINNETFQNGEQVVFELKDAQGNALSGKIVNITYNKNETYSMTTDQNGKGYLTISGEAAGKYDIEATYAGDDKYNGCTAKDTITITDEAPNNVGTSTGDSSETTAQYNNESDDNKTQQLDGTTYYLPRYGIEVRSADNIVIWSKMGVGVGLNVNDWIAQYGNYDPDHPTPVYPTYNSTTN